MPKAPKRPRDMNQWAKNMVDLATGEAETTIAETRSPAREFAREGGLKGGVARARSLTPEQRKAIAKKAASARWKKGRPVLATKE
jgi:hypothetical protein